MIRLRSLSMLAASLFAVACSQNPTLPAGEDAGPAGQDAGSNCSRICLSGDTRCVGSQIESCVQDDSGCWVWGPTQNCPGTTTCDPSSSACAAPCTNTCSNAGATQCAGTLIKTCATGANGCLAWGAAQPCTGGRTCDAVSNQCQGTCVSNCSPAGNTVCSGAQVSTCTDDGTGCLTWGPAKNCPASQTCIAATNQCAAQCTNGCSTPNQTQCQGTLVQTCLTDGTGCLNWSAAAACTGGRTCNSASDKCEGVCNADCDNEGDTQCSGSQVQTCNDDGTGCLTWGSPRACGGNSTCNSATNSCKPTCTSNCSSAGTTQCVNATQVKTCNDDGTGCLTWGMPTTCPNGTACDSGLGNCVLSCTDTCSVLNATECQGGGIQSCVLGSNGCKAWSSPVACPTGSSCDSGHCASTCQSNCTVENQTRCSASLVQTCTADSSGCLSWGAAVSCGGSATCSAGHCTTTCNNTCSVQGTTQCSGTQVQVCNADSYGCLAWSTPAACPNSGSCDSGANACVADPCQGVTTAGTCTSSTTLQFCGVNPTTGQHQIQTQQCASGYVCSVASGSAKCISSGVCTNGQTQCKTGDANTLETCTSGQWADTSCPNGCQANATGAICATAAQTKQVSFTIIYDLKLPNAGRTDWDTTITTRPLVNALVASVSGDNVIDEQITDATGKVTILVPSTPTTNDYVEAVAAGSDGQNWLFMVADPNLAAGQQTVPSLGAAPQTWAWAWYASDLSDGATAEITEQYGSGAAHVFDVMQGVYIKTMNYYNQEGTTLVGWFGAGVSWDCGACFYPVQVSFGSPATSMGSQIFFGGDTTDEEYFASAVLSHEHGHWVMQSYGQSPNEGGTHYLGNPTFPGQAWSEGWATFWNAYYRNDPVYVDKQQGTMFWFDVSQRVYSYGNAWQRPTPANGLLQLMDENEVSAMMWSVLNSASGADASIMTALASTRMTSLGTSFAGRGYTTHTWTVNTSTGAFENVVDTQVPAPCVADMFDGLLCGGMAAASVDAATQPASFYPFPSSSPICQ